MVVRFQWGNRGSSPRVASEFVFIAEALEIVGAALFPDEWTSEEPLSRLPHGPHPDLSLQPMAVEASRRRAEAMQAPPFVYRRRGLFGNPVASIQPRSDECAHVATWAEHLAAREACALNEAHLTKAKRRNAAANWIADGGLVHELETFVRPIGQRGDPAKVNGSTVWGLDPPVWDMVFRRCYLPMVRGDGEVLDCYIFLGRSGLESKLAALRSQAKAKRADRKPHPSSLNDSDDPLLDEMQALIQARKVSGPNPAALALVDRAAGAGTIESKVRRLERKYIAKFGH